MTYTQAEATAQGYCVAITVDSNDEDMDLLIKPDTDLDTEFRAFSIDYSRMVRVKGWLCIIA